MRCQSAASRTPNGAWGSKWPCRNQCAALLAAVANVQQGFTWNCGRKPMLACNPCTRFSMTVSGNTVTQKKFVNSCSLLCRPFEVRVNELTICFNQASPVKLPITGEIRTKREKFAMLPTSMPFKAIRICLAIKVAAPIPIEAVAKSHVTKLLKANANAFGERGL